MASRLFQTVVAASSLLLSGCGSAVVTATPPEPPPDAEAPPEDVAPVVAPDAAPSPPDVAPAPEDAAPEDVAPPPDAAAPPDAATDVVDDRRAREMGWPTTKGVYCTAPDGGDAYCCRSSDGEGRPTSCCLPRGESCVTCDVRDGVCVPREASP